MATSNAGTKSNRAAELTQQGKEDQDGTGCGVLLTALRFWKISPRRQRSCREPEFGGGCELLSSGKQKAHGSRAVKIRLHRKIEHVEGLAPRFEALGVTLHERRVVSVEPKSLAERSGVKVFDLVVKIDGARFTGAVPLHEEIQYLREPVLSLERPGSADLEAIAITMGGDPDWLEAVMGAISGDEVAVLAAARALGSGAPLVERCLTATDVMAVANRVLAATGQPMEPRLPAGASLVEIALEHEHRHIVQLLLGHETLGSGYVAPDAPQHRRVWSGSSGSSGSSSTSSGGSSSSSGSSSTAYRQMDP